MMDWNELYNSAMQPAFENIEDYIGGEGKRLWQELFLHMDKAYGAKPKMTYSGCSEKPGWNVKLQKSGRSFGTLYPEEGGFSVFLVISYKLAPEVDAIIPALTEKVAQSWKTANDFMKNGKYMMFRIENERELRDFIRLCAVKMKPKN